MRAFYIGDDNIEVLEREYFVIIENINIPNSIKGTKIISASNSVDLKNKIIKTYKFNEDFKNEIQLWSKPIGSLERIRLDTVDEIPVNHDTVYVRGVIYDKDYKDNRDNKI